MTMKMPDLMGIAGLRPRKPKVDPKYATFNRRMLAAMFDSVILMLTLAPLVNRWYARNYPPPYIDMPALQTEMEKLGDPKASWQLMWATLHEKGFIDWWVSNTMAQVIVILIYSGICWYFWSSTPGKMIMRIKVVDAKTEQKITPMQIFMRLSGYLLSGFAFMIGFFWMAKDKQRQGWHDKIAGTAVVVIPWRKKPKPESAAADPSGSPEPSRAE